MFVMLIYVLVTLLVTGSAIYVIINRINQKDDFENRDN
jgi:hypothetical protein